MENNKTINLKYDLKNKSYTYKPVQLPSFLKKQCKQLTPKK